jgi:hypothetical protein
MTEGAGNFDLNDREAAAMKLVEGTELKPADLTEILAAYKNGANVLTSADPKPNDKVRLEHPKVEESAGPGPSKPSDGFHYKGAGKKWKKRYATVRDLQEKGSCLPKTVMQRLLWMLYLGHLQK